MPAKNSVKIFVENGYYHAYNRGVEKRDIFLDQRDFATFLYFLKYYLGTPRENDIKQKLHSLHNQVDLLAYCLMPNHYHLLVKQITRDGMTKLIRAVSTSYAGYFNEKYDREGTLFQGKYKAAFVDSDPYLLHLSRYIHANPNGLVRVGPWQGSDPLADYPYSSYKYYLDNPSIPNWIKPHEILAFFTSQDNLGRTGHLNYKIFVEADDADSFEGLENLTIDS